MSGSDLCISRHETAGPRYFHNRIMIFCLPISTFLSMSDLYIPRNGLPILLQANRQTNLAHRYKNVEIWYEAAHFHFWEYIHTYIGFSVQCIFISFPRKADLVFITTVQKSLNSTDLFINFLIYTP